MSRIPFGVRRLDSTIGGGAPPGSLVLLSGEAGAGAREFMYTAALMNALSEVSPDLFDLYYGDIASGAAAAEDVHYVSFTSEEGQVRGEMERALDEEIVEDVGSGLTFHDLSAESYEWGGLLLVHLNHETLTDSEHGQLVAATDGTLLFEWEVGGSSRARTLVVRQFRGILSHIEEENIVQFETEIGDAGFDISDVRKIR